LIHTVSALMLRIARSARPMSAVCTPQASPSDQVRSCASPALALWEWRECQGRGDGICVRCARSSRIEIATRGACSADAAELIEAAVFVWRRASIAPKIRSDSRLVAGRDGKIQR
jgi:hypothetical protein